MRTQKLEGTLRMLTALAAIGTLVPVSLAAAAHLDVTPSISLDQTYDSNVFNTNGNEKRDFILRATPALTFSLRMPQGTLNLRSSIVSDTHYKYTELNTSNSAITLALDSQLPIALTPRLSIAPTGHYVQSRDSYSRSQLLPAGDPLAPAAIASESAIRKSRDYGGGLRVGYLVTPKTDFSLGGRFRQRQFLDNTSISENTDSRVLSWDTTLSYRFTPIVSSGLFFTTSYNTFDNSVDSRTFSGGITGSYRFSPVVSLNARAGASHARETDPAGLADRRTTSPAGSLSLTYAGTDLQASLTVSIDQAGGGSFGRTTRMETVALRLLNQFAQRWRVNLSGNYQRNRSLDPAHSEDLSSADGTVDLQYQLWEWASIRLFGTASHQWADGTVGTDLTRYSACIGFTLGNTYNIY